MTALPEAIFNITLRDLTLLLTYSERLIQSLPYIPTNLYCQSHQIKQRTIKLLKIKTQNQLPQQQTNEEFVYIMVRTFIR